MSLITTVGGWVAAGIAVSLLMAARRLSGERLEAVARACHELRGPLAAVRLGLSLGSRTGELSPGRLRAIDMELGRAALALDDLAGVRPAPPAPRRVGRTRREAGRGRQQLVRLRELDRVAVVELVTDSVEAWRPSADAAGVRLGLRTGGDGGTVWGDRLRLAQAVGNLLANAIRHGGGVVAVAVGTGRGTVRIDVCDDGPGLPVPVAELVRRGRHARGTHGHGLAVASAVAEAHGGRLAAAPAQRGARLVLELPAAPPKR